MAIFEVRGGRITARYLERKHTKASLAQEYMRLLRAHEEAQRQLAEAARLLEESAEPFDKACQIVRRHRPTQESNDD